MQNPDVVYRKQHVSFHLNFASGSDVAVSDLCHHIREAPGSTDAADEPRAVRLTERIDVARSRHIIQSLNEPVRSIVLTFGDQGKTLDRGP